MSSVNRPKSGRISGHHCVWINQSWFINVFREHWLIYRTLVGALKTKTTTTTTATATTTTTTAELESDESDEVYRSDEDKADKDGFKSLGSAIHAHDLKRTKELYKMVTQQRLRLRGNPVITNHLREAKRSL